MQSIKKFYKSYFEFCKLLMDTKNSLIKRQIKFKAKLFLNFDFLVRYIELDILWFRLQFKFEIPNTKLAC